MPPKFTKRRLNLSASFAAAVLVVAFPTMTHAQPTDKAIASRTADIDGVKLHYLPPVTAHR